MNMLESIDPSTVASPPSFIYRGLILIDEEESSYSVFTSLISNRSSELIEDIFLLKTPA